MKLFASFFVLSVSLLPSALAPSVILGQTPAASSVAGIWQGYATLREASVPMVIRISGSGANLKAESLNGPADHPDVTPASSVTFDGTLLVAAFDYFARTLDATVADGKLNGTYGPTDPTAKSAAPTPFIATRQNAQVDPVSAPHAPEISGLWGSPRRVPATKSSKGESAWEFRANPPKLDVRYQACNDHICLPPRTVHLTVPLKAPEVGR